MACGIIIRSIDDNCRLYQVTSLPTSARLSNVAYASSRYLMHNPDSIAEYTPRRAQPQQGLYNINLLKSTKA